MGEGGGEAASTTSDGAQCCGIALGWEREGGLYSTGLGGRGRGVKSSGHCSTKSELARTIREASGARATMTLLPSPAREPSLQTWPLRLEVRSPSTTPSCSSGTLTWGRHNQAKKHGRSCLRNAQVGIEDTKFTRRVISNHYRVSGTKHILRERLNCVPLRLSMDRFIEKYLQFANLPQGA